MDPTSASASEHDSEKENIPPSPSSSRNPGPVPSSSQSGKKQSKKAKPKARKRRRLYTRKRRVVTRKPLADITHIAVESSSVHETSTDPVSETSVDVDRTSVLVRESGGDLGPSTAPVEEASCDLPPPSSGPASALRSRKRKAVDQNDSSPNTKSLRMGFR